MATKNSRNTKVIIIQSMKLAPELANQLTVGTVVSLKPEPDNEYDKKAVAVYLGDDLVGYLANSRNTLNGDALSASMVSTHLSSGKVASATAVLKASYSYTCKSGDSKTPSIQTHWSAEWFPVPVWSAEKEGKGRAITLESVAKNRIVFNDITEVLTNFDSYVQGDLVVKMHTDASGVQKPMVFRNEVLSTPNPAPAGEIKNPPDKLLQALRTGSILPATPVEVTGTNSFKLSVKPEGTQFSAFYDDITRVVEASIMQAMDAKERVTYLHGQGVPAPIIHGVFRNMRRLSNPESVAKPKQMYIQSPDRDYLTRALAYHLAGKNIRLVGEKGAGKNTLAASVCWAMNQPVYRIQGNSELDKIDLLGGQALDEHGTQFVLSDFVSSLMRGEDVILDEVNAIKPEVALILQSMLDDAKSIDVPGYGHINVHPESRIWATMNEEYIGTSAMNDATADRFTPIIMKEASSLSTLLKERFPSAKEEDISICVKIYEQVKNAVKSQKCSDSAVTVRGYIDALDSIAWLPLRLALLDNIAGRSQDPDDRKVITEFINASCPA